MACLTGSPHFSLITKIADCRFVQNHLRYGKRLASLEQHVVGATISANTSNVTVAYTTALALRQAGVLDQLPHSEFVAMVKNSVALPLAQTKLSLPANVAMGDALFENFQAASQGDTSWNDGMATFNEARQRVVLRQPLLRWVHTNAITDDVRPGELPEDLVPHIGDIDEESGRIGCPVSFDPELVKRDFRFIVDVIDRHNGWPKSLGVPLSPPRLH